jgi:hypothetical protein
MATTALMLSVEFACAVTLASCCAMTPAASSGKIPCSEPSWRCASAELKTRP